MKGFTKKGSILSLKFPISALWLILSCLLSTQSFGQHVGINNTGATPDPSAALDVNAPNKGLLIPRLTTNARNGIGSPAAGLVIYNSDVNMLQYWNSAAWIQLSAIPETAVNAAGIDTTVGVAIAASNSQPDLSAMLDVQSLTGGVLIPRMSNTQRNAISSPVSGLLVYNTTTNQLNFNSSSGWTALCETTLGSSTGAITTVANVGINTASPDHSAILDISSTTAGMAIPRLTVAQRNAILSPAQGLMVYNTTTQTINFYDGAAHWFELSSPATPSAPVAGTSSFTPSSITWNWSGTGGSGYKYNTLNNYNTAIDNGASTTYTQTGLTCNSADTLYVWAYNCSGNSASTTLADSIVNCWVCGDTLIDTRDGQSYPTVQIGTQCWMAQNLNYGTRIPISTVNQRAVGTQKFCTNLAGTADDNTCPYGGLYEWNEVMDGVTLKNTNAGVGCDGVSVTASIAGTNMNVTSIITGYPELGQTISGTNVTPGTTITGFTPATASACYITGNGGSAGFNLTIGGTITGTFAVGQRITGPGIALGTTITSMVTGTGGAGTYTCGPVSHYLGNGSITVAASTNTTLNVIGISASVVLAVGQTIWAASGVPAGTKIIAFGTGTGGAGTYTVSSTLNVSNNAIISVFGASPVAINTTAGGLGNYIISTSQTVASTTIYEGAFPACSTPIQGICPTGWHVPAHTEWTLMERSINSSIAFPYNETLEAALGTNEGGALKQTGTTVWAAPNTGATNSTGFNGLPGGNAYNGVFHWAGTLGQWYTSTFTGLNAWYREVDDNNSTITRFEGAESNDMSLRCVKN